MPNRDAKGRYVARTPASKVVNRVLSAAKMAHRAYKFGQKAYVGYKAIRQNRGKATKQLKYATKPRRTRTKGVMVPYASTSVVGGGTRVVKPNKNFTRGVQTCREQGRVLTADYSIYIGHATCPTSTMRLCFFRALVKQLMIKAGKLNPAFDEAYRQFNPTDRFLFRFHINEQAAVTTFNYLVLAGETQESLAQVLYNNQDLQSNQWTADTFEYWPNGQPDGGCTIHLKNAKVDIECVSEFKYQNRTVNFAGQTEADDVTNAPLEGKTYSGFGTGTNFIKTLSPFSMYASNLNGTIEYIGDNQQGLKEPPDAKLFSQVKNSGKVHVAPGEIKISRLYFSKTMLVRDFCRKIWGTAGSTQFQHNTIGTYRMFGLEKTMQVLAVAEEADNLRVAYEHDLKVSIGINPGFQTYSTTIFTDNAGSAPA